MDKKYLEQFTDRSLIEILLHKDNIKPLEFLLDIESKRLKVLKELGKEGKLDFGKKVSRKELSLMFNQVKQDVDAFLGVNGVEIPKHSYFNIFKPGLISTQVLLDYYLGCVWAAKGINDLLNLGLNTDSLYSSILGLSFLGVGATLHVLASKESYDPITKSIRLSKRGQTKLIPTIAHEYAHYLEHKNGVKIFPLKIPFVNKHTIFLEGFARGIERYISNIYNERESNEAFLYNITNNNTSELKEVYVWLCKRFNLNSSKSLIGPRTSLDDDLSFYRFIARKPNPHSLGNAIFYLHETKNGNQIYKNIISGQFNW